MALSEILKLGDPRLLQVCEPVTRDEMPALTGELERMWRLVKEFRDRYGRGRAIAAPQTGIMKRIICINTDRRYALINPVIEYGGSEMMEVWDDCMSFPDLLVKLERHRHIKISFYDSEFNKCTWDLHDDMAELIQHEYDHLDGILAISKAKDISCFKWVERDSENR